MSEHFIPYVENKRSFLFRGEIPRTISRKLISQQPVLLAPLPQLVTTSFEKIPMNILRLGKRVTGKELAQQSLDNGLEEQVKEQLDNIKKIADRIDEPSPQTILETKQIMLQELERLKLSYDVIDNIFAAPITFKKSFEPHYCENGFNISISKFNIIRRSLDYQQLFGSDIDLKNLAHIFTRRIIAHELGHVLDNQLGKASLSTSQYDLRQNSVEARAERFAEYWGRKQFSDDSVENQIIQNDCLLHVAGTYHMWQTIDAYDKNIPDNNFCILEYFDTLRESISDPDVLGHLDTRQRTYDGLYAGREAELYAAPYSQHTVYNAISSVFSNK